MNSEELEVSLRTEFESYLKGVFAETRREISQLQEKVESEIEKHKSQLDEVFKDVLSRVQDDRDVDAGFKDSVVEHLRLARDEGARITATAIAEAEELEMQSAPKVGLKELHAAVNDISSKTSQAEILKTLVQHAGQFTPRGAFFIIKNEHFGGWRTFGEEKGDSEEVIREVFLPVTADSILSESVRSLTTVESNSSTYADDAGILGKLQFGGSPDKTYAIPLVVRGRAVAVLYADYGMKGAEVILEALETMVRVAGLTVEVLASAKGNPAPRDARKKTLKSFSESNFAPVEQESPQPEFAATPSYSAPVAEPSYKTSFDTESFNHGSYHEEPVQSRSSFDDYKTEEPHEDIPTYIQDEAPAAIQSPESYQSYETTSWNEAPAVETVTEINADDYFRSEPQSESFPQSQQTEYQTNDYSQNYQPENNVNDYSQGFAFKPTEPEPEVQTENDFSARPVNEYQFDQGQPFEAPKEESLESFSQSAYEAPAPVYEAPIPVPETNFAPVSEEKPEVVSNSAETSFIPEPISQPTQQTPPVRSRFSERNVDLPIEVSEDERRLHNDARRFARLLVSEIKLYNEQKVKEGREQGDLYERLREAIDRSREMYDKRVQPNVSAKFDYFHYELVNTLAEGDEHKLGDGYPGSSV